MRCKAYGLDEENPNRSCGFLTNTERQYLLNDWPEDGKPSNRQRTEKESDIRIRTRHALADLALLEQEAGDELKQSIIREDVDAEIFRDETREHMMSGLLKLALDASIGEDSSELLFRTVADSGISDQFANMMEAAAEEDPEMMIDAMIPLLAEVHPESEHQLRELLISN